MCSLKNAKSANMYFHDILFFPTENIFWREKKRERERKKERERERGK